MWHDCHPLGAQILTATPPAMMVKRPPLEAQWTPAVAQEKRKVVLLQKGFTKDFANTMTKEQLDLIPEAPPELVPAPRFGRSATTPSITTVFLWANIRILQGLYDLGCAMTGAASPWLPPSQGMVDGEAMIQTMLGCQTMEAVNQTLTWKCNYMILNAYTILHPRSLMLKRNDMFWSSQLPLLHPPIPAVPAVPGEGASGRCSRSRVNNFISRFWGDRGLQGTQRSLTWIASTCLHHGAASNTRKIHEHPLDWLDSEDSCNWMVVNQPV